jgi:SAM-dependent methyltransferase
LSAPVPYRSTVHFTAFLKDCLGRAPASILHSGCGTGSELAYFGSEFPDARLVGMEADPGRAGSARDCVTQQSRTNVTVEEADWLLPPPDSHRFDGVISLYALSEHEDAKTPLAAITAWSRQWIAASVLAWEGDYDFTIHARPLRREGGMRPSVYYNIYSLITLQQLLSDHGMATMRARPFEMDVDLPRPASAQLRTYTARTAEGERMQISGPLLMPWWFIYAERAAGGI